METVHRFSVKRCRLPKYDLKLGIRTEKKHYLAFMVNRPILLYGFGIFGTIMAKSLGVEYGLLMDDFCNPGNQKLVLMKCTTVENFNGHRDVYPLYFLDPVRIRRFKQYILYLDVSGYQTYVGENGSETLRADKVKFMFVHDFDRSSLSTPKEGNFPALYYQNIKKIDHGKAKQKNKNRTSQDEKSREISAVTVL